MQRPMGVTILAILAAIGGVLGILAGLLLVGLSSAAADLAIPGLSGLVAILGMVTIVVGVWRAGIRLRRLEPQGLGMDARHRSGDRNIVVDLLEFRSATASSTLIGIVIAGIILYYLYQPHVRRAFGQSV